MVNLPPCAQRWAFAHHHYRAAGPRASIPVIELFNLGSVSVTRYRWRGSHIPSHWTASAITPRHDLVESRMR